MAKPTREWNLTQTAWRKEQDRLGVPTIEQTVIAQTQDGREVEANRLDYNLAFATDRVVQLTDTSWIKARALLTRATAA